MSIVNKIESISNHLKNAYNSLENIGVDLTNIDKNIENLSAQIENVYDDLSKVTDENTEITLSPTKKGKMELTLKGNTNQYTTTGKNYLPTSLDIMKIKNTDGVWNNNVYTYNGLTFTIKDDLSITIGGNFSNETIFRLTNGYVNFSQNIFILSGCPSDGGISTYSLVIDEKDGDTYVTSYSDTGNQSTINVSSLTSPKLNSYIKINSSSAIGKTFHPMLRLSSVTSDTYEPYTGGVESPNPDYPQEVEVVNGNNEIVVEGKNLLPISSLNNRTLNGITFTNNEDGSYTLNGTATAEAVFYIFDGNIKINANSKLTFSCNNLDSQIALYWYDNWATISGSNMKIGKGNPNYTTTNEINAIQKLRITISVNDGATINNLTIKPMIEKGAVVTEYESYQKQTYPINLGTLELCKINNYQDYIYEENNNWYISNKIHKKIINGTESGYSNPSENRFNIDNILNTYYKSTDKITYYSNQYIGYGQKPDNASFNSLVANINYGFDFTNANTNTIRIKDTRFTTLEDFKTSLSNNNLIIYYVLATPIITQIVDQTLISQLNAIKNAKSYKNETNIYQTNDNLPFIINASALKKND